jgi:hypothetical protein
VGGGVGRLAQAPVSRTAMRLETGMRDMAPPICQAQSV